MKTYSDALNPIRVFLGDRTPTLLESYEKDGALSEMWGVQGTQIILRVTPAGAWEVFIPVSQTATEPQEKITALERYLHGQRKDLEAMIEMGNIARTFLNRLGDMPACTDPDCVQSACVENRDLRQAIESFQSRLLPITKEGNKNVRD